MDYQQYLKNRRNFPLDELARYAGSYVAWSPEGDRIIANDEDPLRLEELIKALGYDPAEIVVSSVPYPDEVILGGGGFD